MVRFILPVDFRRKMRTRCSTCSYCDSTARRTCTFDACGLYPFRFGRLYKRGFARRVKDSLNIFDCDANWPEVVPVLDDPLAVRALDAGMNDFCFQYPSHGNWDPRNGPWRYNWEDYWINRADEQFMEAGLGDEFDQWCIDQWCLHEGCPREEVDAAVATDELSDKHPDEYFGKYEELCSQFYPQPGTPDWYRAWGTCHWLAGWNCAIGTLLFPRKEWFVVQSDKHSTAIGIDDSGITCMDILFCQEYQSEIRQCVLNGKWYTLDEEIEFRESSVAESSAACPQGRPARAA